MKIFNFGLDITPGKHKYKDKNFDKLVEKFSPQKLTPFVVEFIDDDIEKADTVVFNQDKKFDLVFIDLEKIEKRLEKTQDQKEKDLLSRAQKELEQEKLLCDIDFNEEELNILKLQQLVTLKPAVGKQEIDDLDELINEVIEKSGVLLFFTAGKKEVHTWSVEKGEIILEAAGKIHSDLKRGFIKGEVGNCKDLGSFFNWNEAKSRGFVKLVDKDYIMQENDIIEIRFNV